MSEVDILAWVIVALFVSTVVLPATASYISDDNFMSYKDAWLLGHGIVIFMAIFGTAIYGILWAFERVVW